MLVINFSVLQWTYYAWLCESEDVPLALLWYHEAEYDSNPKGSLRATEISILNNKSKTGLIWII